MKKTWLVLICLVSLAYNLAAQEKPDFTLRDFDNKEHTLSSLVGNKLVVIHFWASWCLPSHTETRELVKLFATSKANCNFITICIDDEKYLPNAKAMCKANKYPFLMLVDTVKKTTWQQFNPNLEAPFTVLLDKSGLIIYRHSGFVQGDEKELLAKIDAALRQN